MPDTAEKKSADYEFRWKFLDDISRLVPGKKYKFEMTGRRIRGNADKNTNTAWMMSSNQGGVLAKKAGIASLANVLSVSKSKSNVVAWPIQSNNVATGTVEIVGKLTQDTTYFTFKFDFASFPFASNSKGCSFEVVYVYGKNAPPDDAAASPLNESSVFETYRTSGNRLFQFQRQGDNLVGTQNVKGVGSTKVTARRTMRTIIDKNGNSIEIAVYDGVFTTERNNGSRIQGTTSIARTETPGELKITSTYYQEGKKVSINATMNRVSIFK
jgi:hypothetical protein